MNGHSMENVLRGLGPILSDVLNQVGGHLERSQAEADPTKKLCFGQQKGEIENTPEKFSVSIDTCHFRPNDLKVSLEDGRIVVEGTHEEREDGFGSIQRTFKRTYAIPEDTNVEGITSTFNREGHLTINAPKKVQGQQPRAIPIHFAS